MPLFDFRLRLATLIATIARLSTASIEDLAKTTGLSEEREIHAAAETHLMDLASSLLSK